MNSNNNNNILKPSNLQIHAPHHDPKGPRTSLQSDHHNLQRNHFQTNHSNENMNSQYLLEGGQNEQEEENEDENYDEDEDEGKENESGIHGEEKNENNDDFSSDVSLSSFEYEDEEVIEQSAPLKVTTQYRFKKRMEGRSSSPFPTLLDDLEEQDEELPEVSEEEVHYLRFRSQYRLKTAWEKICEKYGKNYDDEADEIDIFTGKIIVDKGCMKKRPCTEIGTLTEEVDDTGVDEAWADPEVRETFRKSQNRNNFNDLQQELDAEMESEILDVENGPKQMELMEDAFLHGDVGQQINAQNDQQAVDERKYFEIDAPHDYFTDFPNVHNDQEREHEFIETYLAPPPLQEIRHQQSSSFPAFQATKRNYK